VKACFGYGDSYLVLKKVRLRTSFSDKDTSNCDSKIASCEYYTHVLATYTDEELRAVLSVASGRQKFCPSEAITVYKEVQIHGPIKLDEHIESLVVNNRHKSQSDIKKKVEDWARRCGFKVTYL